MKTLLLNKNIHHIVEFKVSELKKIVNFFKKVDQFAKIRMTKNGIEIMSQIRNIFVQLNWSKNNLKFYKCCGDYDLNIECSDLYKILSSLRNSFDIVLHTNNIGNKYNVKVYEKYMLDYQIKSYNYDIDIYNDSKISFDLELFIPVFTLKSIIKDLESYEKPINLVFSGDILIFTPANNQTKSSWAFEIRLPTNDIFNPTHISDLQGRFYSQDFSHLLHYDSSKKMMKLKITDDFLICVELESDTYLLKSYIAPYADSDIGLESSDSENEIDLSY